MTSEKDFQTALDANLFDWHTRLVFADWLQDRGDKRAEGYRAIGNWHKCPHLLVPSDRLNDHRAGKWFWYGWVRPGGTEKNRATLPPDWFNWKLLNGLALCDMISLSRQEAEDAAALAFAGLSIVRRVQLLTKETVNV